MTPHGTLTACLLICLMLFVTGCTRYVDRTEVLYVYPPAEWVQGCPVPDRDVQTVGDVMEWVPDLIETIRRCDADMRAVRGWSGE